MATNFRREIGQNRRHVFLLGTRIPQRMTGTAERICVKCTWKTCLVLRSTSVNVEVKSQSSRSPGTKNSLCTHNTPRHRRNGTRSLQTTSGKKQTRRFRRCRGVTSPACVRWAWRATAGLCQALLVICLLLGFYLLILYYILYLFTRYYLFKVDFKIDRFQRCACHRHRGDGGDD